MIFHFILARKHGEAAGYPVAAAFDDAGLSALVAKYNELTSGAGQKTFAAENSELLFATVDGESIAVRHTHQFSDPSHLESRRLAAALSEAIRIQQEQSTAQANLAQSQAQLASAEAAIRELDPEQKELLAAHADRIAAAHAATQPRELPSEAEQQAERDRIAAASKEQRKAAAESAEAGTASLQSSVVGSAAPDGSPSDYDGLDDTKVEDLKTIASDEGVDLKGATLKADIITRIRAFRIVAEAHTVDELKSLAQTQNAEVTGAKVKADYVNAIVAATPQGTLLPGGTPPALPPAL